MKGIVLQHTIKVLVRDRKEVLSEKKRSEWMNAWSTGTNVTNTLAS